MFLGTRFKHFPNVLVFTLNRFAFDFERMDRVKLNSYFEFNLEERLSHLVDDGHDHEFELYGVIIHRGSAHGGHYLAYIRDLMHESNWAQSIEETHQE
jgi:ubiquitin carboxyl-terminal hydrolase 40